MARLDTNTLPQLSETVITKLHSRNIFTVYDLMFQTCEELIIKTGLNFKEVQGIKSHIHEKFGGEVVTSFGLYQRECRDIISTGIKSLDDLLEGGLRCGKIYEICGSSSAGKSQLCLWISMYVTLNALTEVHYVDSSKNFCASRIQALLESRHSTDKVVGNVMTSIKVHRIHDTSSLFTVLYALSNMPKNERKHVLIVDSLSILFVLLAATDANPILANFASIFRYFVNHFRAVIVIVNTVKFEHNGRPLNVKDKNCFSIIKPSLGNYWLSVPNVRLLITHLENNKREISIWKSCQLKDGETCYVDIKDEGFCEI